MRSDRDRLADIQEAIERIRRHTTAGRAAFEANELIQSWVVRHLQIIGEAASRISNETQRELGDVPWRSIVGMRNVLVHSYFEIDIDAVWAVVEHDLDPLEASVRRHLAESEEREAVTEEEADRPEDDLEEAERRFAAEVVQGVETLKREVGYNPTRFLQMVGEHGAVGGTKRLLQGSQYSEGFTTLWEKRRLDMSVEALALLPWYRPLFSDDERSRARRRLEEYGFAVDAFLDRADSEPPAWVRRSN